MPPLSYLVDLSASSDRSGHGKSGLYTKCKNSSWALQKGLARRSRVSNSSMAPEDPGATGRRQDFKEALRKRHDFKRSPGPRLRQGNFQELSFSTVSKGFRRARDGFIHMTTLHDPQCHYATILTKPLATGPMLSNHIGLPKV